MSFTYDPSTDAGRVRLMIADTVDAGHTFEDNEIAAFLDINDGSVRFAAADALDSLAANYARLAKRIKVLDIDVDTKDAAKALREQAKALREQEDDSGNVEIAELVTNHFSARERIWKQFQRGVI